MSKLRVRRVFTKLNEHPFDTIKWSRRNSRITEPDGSLVFELKDAEIPADWSQLASDIVIAKYFRKSGLGQSKKEGETSVRQVIKRIAHTISIEGLKRGYFVDGNEAVNFEMELTYLLLHQYGAFNSPVWFNCGLSREYGITGSGGLYAWSDKKGRVYRTKDAYKAPQCSACFIQSTDDDLMSIFELLKTEARLFKYGSGTGSNFSNIRARQEKLSGGGTSSGLMSFLEVFDRAAGATKSGGTTRRAAKMVCLDMDHPEIVDFIELKLKEEKKAHTLIKGGYPSDFNGEAYRTITGQNANNSIRVSDEFMNLAVNGGKWQTKMRTTGEVVQDLDAKELWDKVAKAAWACADPGIQYDTTINEWHTCPNSGKINASNPCSEYMFLDDTACNLSSLNLTKFVDTSSGKPVFNMEGYRHAARVFFIAQEILVSFSSYPTKQIAKNSHDYRPLGLGYANLGTLLMLYGVPYDSDKGRAIAGCLTAVLTGHAYKTSAELAAAKGPFEGFAKNRDPMLKVIGKHLAEAVKLAESDAPHDFVIAAIQDWEEALALGKTHGYRNAQATVLAPTGTIGLLMDCDTTGVEPDFSVVKFKKLAGGGVFKIVNSTVNLAKRKLGYTKAQVADILTYLSGTNKISSSQSLVDALHKAGLTDDDIASVDKQIPKAFSLEQAFFVNGSISEVLQEKLKPSKEHPFHTKIGLTKEQWTKIADTVMGYFTVEGAPHIKPEHLAVFDCANRCGKYGTRMIEPKAHLLMMAAAQPFLSGAISKTVNLANEATVEEVKGIYELGHKLGLKAVALYRDGCKLSQVLNTSSDDKEEPQPTAKINQPIPHGRKNALPKRRQGFTQETTIAGQKVFLRTGEYADGQLGEIFIDMHKEGAAFRSLMNCFAIAVSMGLQRGVTVGEYVDQFTFTRFEPCGAVVGDPHVKFSTSIIDYVFRVVGVHYAGRHELAHVKPDGSAADANATASQTDAPFCETCGHLTVRNAACYRCLNCGTSMGCS